MNEGFWDGFMAGMIALLAVIYLWLMGAYAWIESLEARERRRKEEADG